TWLATILSAGLRICGGAFSGYCACLFLTSSASGLSCCPSFSFSATSDYIIGVNPKLGHQTFVNIIGYNADKPITFDIYD
ncbi:MAG: hypothetical protein II407_03015, partial [Prevotella sp.]|nr:hypothetical protein [Prevotella sp.]